jgi:hypothetical protein
MPALGELHRLSDRGVRVERRLQLGTRWRADVRRRRDETGPVEILLDLGQRVRAVADRRLHFLVADLRHGEQRPRVVVREAVANGEELKSDPVVKAGQ